MIRIAAPDLGEGVEALVLEVLRSGRLAQGPMVARFEQLCAEMAGVEHAIAVANGTLSLELALEAMGIGPGDVVVTTPFTFAATLNAILRRGASARFVDIGDDFNMDPDALAAIDDDLVSAVVPVHLYGLPADMDAISSACAARGWSILEDAAQAHGATVGGRSVGSFGVGSFSFYATKNVTSGEGGCLTTSDEALAARLRLLRNQGMSARYRYDIIGTNARMTELQAAIAIPQLERLDALNERRATNAARLDARLQDAGLELPSTPPGRTHVWHQYTVLLPEAADRGHVVEHMAAAGVEVGVYYPGLVWEHPPYAEHPGVAKMAASRAADVASRCLSLPVHAALTEHDVDLVAAALRDALV